MSKADEYYVRLDEGDAPVATAVPQKDPVPGFNGNYVAVPGQQIVVVGQILASSPFEDPNLLPYPDEKQWHYNLCDRYCLNRLLLFILLSLLFS